MGRHGYPPEFRRRVLDLIDAGRGDRVYAPSVTIVWQGHRAP